MLGKVVAVRLGDDATQLVPFDPTSEHKYVLAPLVDQEFRLGGGGYDANATFDETLVTEGALLFAGGDFFNNPVDEPLADLYSPVANSLDEPSLIVGARLRLSAASRTTTRRLPTGRYKLGPIAAPIGWWIDGLDVLIDGSPILLTPRRVPVARVTLRRNEHGEVIAPVHVHFYIHSTGPGAESSGEVRLPSEAQGDQLSISLRLRYPDESQDSYALILYWADGTSTMTTEGPWQDLLTPIDLNVK